MGALRLHAHTLLLPTRLVNRNRIPLTILIHLLLLHPFLLLLFHAIHFITLFILVRMHMPGKLVRPGIGLGAQMARIPFFSRMRLLMLGQIARFGKRTTTDGTRKRSIPAMNPEVVDQRPTRGKPFIATGPIARKGSLTTVRTHVQ